MLLNCNNYSADQLYFLLTQTVIPRPIAWVLSDNGDGAFNVAPFSFFNAITSDPPILMISVGWKDAQTQKDTWINIDQRNEFVVHIAWADSLDPLVASAATLPHGASEVDALQIELDTVDGQRLPKIKDAPIVFFCEKYAIQEIGEARQALILGKIQQIWLSDDIVENNNGRLKIDARKVNPLARLGLNDYALLGDILSKKRPA